MTSETTNCDAVLNWERLFTFNFIVKCANFELVHLMLTANKTASVTINTYSSIQNYLAFISSLTKCSVHWLFCYFVLFSLVVIAAHQIIITKDYELEEFLCRKEIL